MKLIYQIALSLLLLFPLTGCINKSNEAVHTVEQYLQALVAHNSNQVSNLACQDWEFEALLEIDSFQLVKASLDQLNCTPVEESADGVVVQCSGSIVTSYNNEVTNIELDQRNFFVKNEHGDLFVCGYREKS
jgi:hypothetical protein